MKIGIRTEDKNEWERRAPLAPEHVAQLTAAGVAVLVEPSPRRAFADADYQRAGAELAPDLMDRPDCPVVLAVKEIPTRLLREQRTYVYFAHVIKGQPYNMPMLQRVLELGATLIDYERVVDDQGRRLIFFGRHAGLAGMLDSLWALGRRLEHEGFDTPFARLQPAHAYADLAAAERAVDAVGRAIASQGLPIEIGPLVFGFAGYGNVSQGAQAILDRLPHRSLEPEQLAETLRAPDPKRVTKVVFAEQHMVRPLDPQQPFALQDYYQHPERYRGVFGRYVPYLSVLVNCIYWTPDYPRLVSRDLLRGMFGAGLQPRLRVIGDISIDIEGAVECSLKATDPSAPVYVYLPEQDRVVDGVSGHGPVVLAVDNLPCELPVEATRDFGDALLPYVAGLAGADRSVPFAELDLPAPLKRAVIAHRGQLTPDYAYLQEPLRRALSSQEDGRR